MGTYTELIYRADIGAEHYYTVNAMLEGKVTQEMKDRWEFFNDDRAEYMIFGFDCKANLEDGVLDGCAEIKNYDKVCQKYLKFLIDVSTKIHFFSTRLDDECIFTDWNKNRNLYIGE